MGLEAATFIANLIEDWPTADDFRREGDDHFRMLKGVLKRTFPNASGAYTLTPNQANGLLAYIAAIEANARTVVPAGVIAMWSGTIATVPEGWALCDGTQGTPDLRDRFIVGAGTAYAPGNTGGATTKVVVGGGYSVTVTVDEHILSLAEFPAHAHGGYFRTNFQRYGGVDSGVVIPGETGDLGSTPEVPATPDSLVNSTASVGPLTQEAGGGAGGVTEGHIHTAAGAVTIPNQNIDVRPAYYALAYIMKLAAATAPVPPPAA